MNSATDDCNGHKSDVEFLYIEVNVWYLNGVAYIDFNRAVDIQRKQGGLVVQLFQKIRNPDY